MPFNDRCWRPPRVALVIVTLFSSGCATAGFEAPPSACPPVVEYSRKEQARVAEDVARLPEGTAIIGWLVDYAVLREQVRAYSRRQAGTRVRNRGAP